MWSDDPVENPPFHDYQKVKQAVIACDFKNQEHLGGISTLLTIKTLGLCVENTFFAAFKDELSGFDFSWNLLDLESSKCDKGNLTALGWKLRMGKLNLLKGSY